MAGDVSKMRIAFENAFDFSDEVPNSLKSVSRNRVETFTDIDVDPFIWLEGNFQSLTFLNFFCLWRHNLTENGKYRIQLFRENNQLDTVYDSHFVDAWNFQGNKDFLGWDYRFSVKFFPDVIQARSFRIFLKDESLSEAKVSRIWTGEYLSPKFDPDFGVPLVADGRGENTRGGFGSLYSENQAEWRSLDGNIQLLGLNDAETFFNGFILAKKSRDVFFSLFPEEYNFTERDYTFLGKFRDRPQKIITHAERQTISLNMEEI